jgi:hypothetical protein
MPQDASLSQRNSAMARDFHGSMPQACGFMGPVPCAPPLFLVMRVVVLWPVMRVVVPWMVLWDDSGLCRRGFGRRGALVLLRGAHRAHRQLEGCAARGIGSRDRVRTGHYDGNHSDQVRSVTGHNIHGATPAGRSGAAQGSDLRMQLKDAAALI